MELIWKSLAGGLALGLAGQAAPALAQAEPLPTAQAAGFEVFASTDSEGSDTIRVAGDFDISNRGPERRYGVRIEQAWYTPLGTATRERTRGYVRASDVTDGGWSWSVLAGTDGHTAIGSASLHDDTPWRKEFFVERDVVETPRGLDEKLYSTFAGAALDVPLARTTTLTLLGGAQEFTGDNLRLHARANLVQVIKEDIGLSAQLRLRYFHDSTPREYDYYSPRWFAQVLPVVQMRRFVDGWELVGVLGVGAQRDATSDWRRADYAQIRVRSPLRGDWYVSGDVTYSNTPGGTAQTGAGYRYGAARVAVTRRF